MMNCRLFTADKRHVTDVTIPPFNTPPEVLVWGERFFALDKTTTGFIQPEYLEAFTYFVLPAKAVAE